MVIQLKLKRETRKLTPEQAERYSRLAEEIEQEFREGRTVGTDPSIPPNAAEVWELRYTIRDLREERLQQGKTLADVAAASGLAPAVVSRLESGKTRNPTWATITRYAHALGKHLALEIENAPKAPSPKPRKQASKARPKASKRSPR